jgi:CheY-like chemotaxis protein
MPSPLQSQPAATGSLQIVVVENHEDTRTSLAGYLRSLGHRVECVSNMAEALEAVPASPCDVLISDIGLEDGDGWELLCQLNPPSRLFAVAISGYCSLDDVEKSLAVGYQRHLIKPFTPDDIRTVLQAARAHHAKVCTS